MHCAARGVRPQRHCAKADNGAGAGTRVAGTAAAAPAGLNARTHQTYSSVVARPCCSAQRNDSASAHHSHVAHGRLRVLLELPWVAGRQGLRPVAVQSHACPRACVVVHGVTGAVSDAALSAGTGAWQAASGCWQRLHGRGGARCRVMLPAHVVVVPATGCVVAADTAAAEDRTCIVQR
jgi:hypothetical protein